MTQSAPLPWTDMRGLAHVLLNGTPESRRAAAARLLEAEDHLWLALLADTVRSNEAWQLRARCLEVLGLAAGASERYTAEAILTAVLAQSDAARRSQAPAEE